MLPPLFIGPSSGCTRDSDTDTEQDSATIHILSDSQSPMFLVNSRSLLDTETNSFQSWHPFFQRYRANLPNSLAWIEPIRLGFLTQGHLCQFSVRSREVTPVNFSRAPGIGRSGQNVRLITHSPRSHHYGSPEVSTLQQAGEPA